MGYPRSKAKAEKMVLEASGTKVLSNFSLISLYSILRYAKQYLYTCMN